MTDHQSTTELEKLRATVNRLEKLLEVSRILSSNLNLDNLLLSIVNAAKQLTQTEAASILLLDKRTGALYFEATTSQQRDTLARVLVPLEGSIAGWIVQNGQPLVLNDAARDPRHFTEPDKETDFVTKALLGVPLQVKDKTIGVLEVLNPTNGSAFQEEDVQTIVILAGHAAVAIENARLFEQSDQINDIAHELRTPITAIVGYTDLMLMRKDLDRDAQQSFLETINQEGKNLTEMINNFLDLARLETRRMHPEMEEFDLNEIAQEAVSLLEPQAQKNQLALGCSLPDGPTFITADPNHIKQVLVNLLSNAIKYNRPQGCVDIQLRPNGPQVDIVVADTGIGMPPETTGHIFDKFYRVEEHEDKAAGTGLGLAIVKQIIEAHGGAIAVKSRLDQGSTFTITLPVEQSL